MKYCVFFLAFALVAADDFYTTKYDQIDIDAILSNPRLSENYVQCLLDAGKCTEDGKVLKSVVPDALITDCAKCSEIQRVSVDKVFRFLVKSRKPDFDALTAKYDPEGIYVEKYKKYLEKL